MTLARFSPTDISPPKTYSAGMDWWKKLRQYSFSILWLLIALKQVILIISIPPWEIADEPAHWQYVQMLVEEHRFPVQGAHWQHLSPELRQSIRKTEQRLDRTPLYRPEFVAPLEPSQGQRQSAPSNIQPENFAAVFMPAYYYYQAIPYTIFREHPIESRLYAMRAFSSVLLLLTIWIAAKTVRLVGGSWWLAMTVGACIGFQPMVGIISAGVNNDSLAMLLGTLILYLLARLLQANRLTWRLAAVIGVVIGLAIANKYFAVAFLPLALVTWAMKAKGANRPHLWPGLGLITMVAVAIGMAWLIRVNAIGPAVAFGSRPLPELATIISELPHLVAVDVLIRTKLAFITFWAIAGWNYFNGFWSMAVYSLLGLTVAILFIRFIFWLVQSPPSDQPWRRWLVLTLLAPLFFEAVFQALYYYGALHQAAHFFPYHGRYYFPIIVPIALILILGLKAFWRGWREWQLFVLVTALMLVAQVSVICLLAKTYG